MNKNHVFITIDESYFGGNFIGRKRWVLKDSNDDINKFQYLGKLSLILAISEKKIVHYCFHRININSDIFFNFINELIIKIHDDNELNSKYMENKIVFQLDNAQIHKKNLFLNKYKDKNIKFLFSPTYFCKMNSVEYIFNILKLEVSKIVFDNVENRMKACILKIEKIESDIISNCTSHTFNIMAQELQYLIEILK